MSSNSTSTIHLKNLPINTKFKCKIGPIDEWRIYEKNNVKFVCPNDDSKNMVNRNWELNEFCSVFNDREIEIIKDNVADIENINKEIRKHFCFTNNLINIDFISHEFLTMNRYDINMFNYYCNIDGIRWYYLKKCDIVSERNVFFEILSNNIKILHKIMQEFINQENFNYILENIKLTISTKIPQEFVYEIIERKLKEFMHTIIFLNKNDNRIIIDFDYIDETIVNNEIMKRNDWEKDMYFQFVVTSQVEKSKKESENKKEYKVGDIITPEELYNVKIGTKIKPIGTCVIDEIWTVNGKITMGELQRIYEDNFTYFRIPNNGEGGVYKYEIVELPNEDNKKEYKVGDIIKFDEIKNLSTNSIIKSIYFAYYYLIIPGGINKINTSNIFKFDDPTMWTADEFRIITLGK